MAKRVLTKVLTIYPELGFCGGIFGPIEAFSDPS
jgi:hypothetical protein